MKGDKYRNLRLQDLGDLNGHLRQKLQEFIETKAFNRFKLNDDNTGQNGSSLTDQWIGTVWNPQTESQEPHWVYQAVIPMKRKGHETCHV